MEEEGVKEVVVDTYTLLAIVYDEVSGKARRVLEDIRTGRVKGLIPATVAYEYIIHWLKGRIPGLKSIDEVVTYLKTYFRIVNLFLEDYLEVAKIKVKGDQLLKEAEDPGLRNRRLSIVDSTVVALAQKKIPVISGDRDLAHVAKEGNIEVIW